MAEHTSLIVPAFDFRAAESLSVEERFQKSLVKARQVAGSGYQEICDFPCVPAVGASDHELLAIEQELGMSLPNEYRVFLKQCRYLKLDDGTEIGGLDHEGLLVTESPWLSDKHRPNVPYLIFANYWRYADGDQLMFDMSDASRAVIVYLHEHGPLYEFYAPSFSLALWRLVHEFDDEE